MIGMGINWVLISSISVLFLTVLKQFTYDFMYNQYTECMLTHSNLQFRIIQISLSGCVHVYLVHQATSNLTIRKKWIVISDEV